MARALAGAVATLRETLGPDPASWAWGRLHLARPRHPLSAAFPAPRASSIRHRSRPAATATPSRRRTSSRRRASSCRSPRSRATCSTWATGSGARWIVPLGASGHPGSPHYADQSRGLGGRAASPDAVRLDAHRGRGGEPPAPRAGRRSLISRSQPLMPGMSKPRAASPHELGLLIGGQLDRAAAAPSARPDPGGSGRWSPSARGSWAPAAAPPGWPRSPPADDRRRRPASSGTAWSIGPGLTLPVAVMQPTCRRCACSASRKTSLPANTSKPVPANASSIAFVLLQSPDESFTPGHRSRVGLQEPLDQRRG